MGGCVMLSEKLKCANFVRLNYVQYTLKEMY